MSGKRRKSVIAVPRERTVIDADSDVEIIEANITVIDLDETSNDALNIQSAEQIAPEVIVSFSMQSNAAIDAPAEINKFSVSPSSAVITSSASSTPLHSRQIQPLPDASIEQPILPSTTEKTHVPPQNVITVTRESAQPEVLVIEESPEAAQRSLFYSDSRGAVPDTVHRVPLYDSISDSSFCSLECSTPARNRSIMPTIDLDDVSFDSHVMPSPKLKKRKRQADDSVIFVSETLHSNSQAASFIRVPDLVILCCFFLSSFKDPIFNIFFYYSNKAKNKAT